MKEFNFENLIYLLCKAANETSGPFADDYELYTTVRKALKEEGFELKNTDIREKVFTQCKKVING